VTALILTYLQARITHARSLRTRRDEGAYSVEFVVVTALVVGLAIAAIAVIVTKVMSRANGIDLGGGG